MIKHLCATLAIACLGLTSSFAQNTITTKAAKGKFYLSTNFDTYLLSTSNLTTARVENKLTTPRFTGFFHIGFNGNYDFTSNFGLQIGLNLKNIGFIEKFSGPDYTIIRRAYTVGIPLALKFGNLEGNNTYFMVGGGVDFPIHYKEKGFSKRSNKEKMGEWFSSRTEQVLPYVFVGARFNPGVVLKFQYYPSNFMNQDFASVEATDLGIITTKPYSDYNVNLMVLTLGFDIKYTPKY